MLHIDRNSFYGGAEAALTLQEAEEWAKRVEQDAHNGIRTPFANAVVTTRAASGAQHGELGFSRAYSLALAPQIIYARSAIIPALVSSKVDRQLDFLAVGSWWILRERSNAQDAESATTRFVRVPNGREDVFADPEIDVRSKRALMKFLRFVSDYENQPELWQAHLSLPFSSFMTDHFKLSSDVQQSLLGLTLSTDADTDTTVDLSLQRTARHLRSIGHFGAGFGAVIPKWGGLAEIAQVGCRAGAVGGGVYVLGQCVTSSSSATTRSPAETPNSGPHDKEKDASLDKATFPSAANRPLQLKLSTGDNITTQWLVGSSDNMPLDSSLTTAGKLRLVTTSKTIVITNADLESFFPVAAEGAPAPAVAIAVFPSTALRLSTQRQDDFEPKPVYIMIHNSSTGECPAGQCTYSILPVHFRASVMINIITYIVCNCIAENNSSIYTLMRPSHCLCLSRSVWTLLTHAVDILYASTAQKARHGFALLDAAIERLCRGNQVETANVLWKLQYEQHTTHDLDVYFGDAGLVCFPSLPADLAFNDVVLKHIKTVWDQVMDGDDQADGFMTFVDRQSTEDEEFAQG